MAQFTMAALGWTATAIANGGTAGNSTYQALRTVAAGAAKIGEVSVSGEGVAASVNRMVLRRISSNASTPTNVVPAPLSPFSQAALTQGYVLAGTGPTVASTIPLIVPGVNAYGGIYRWVAAPGEEIWQATATAPNSESILATVGSGGGVFSSHIIFEEC